MIDPNKARADYQAAMAIVTNIANSATATREQRAVARAAMNKLTLEYIDQLEDKLDLLSKQYQTFIADMQQVITDIAGSPDVVTGLKDLNRLVETGAEIVKGIKGDV